MHTSQTSPVNAHSNAQNAESTFTNQPVGSISAVENIAEKVTPAHRPLPAGLWLRAVLGFEAPFGHDGMPTVWG